MVRGFAIRCEVRHALGPLAAVPSGEPTHELTGNDRGPVGGRARAAERGYGCGFEGCGTGFGADEGARRPSEAWAQGGVLANRGGALLVCEDQVHDQERLVESCLECGVASLGQTLVAVVELHELVQPLDGSALGHDLVETL